MLMHRFWVFFHGVYLPLVAGGALLWFLRRPSPFLSRLLLAWGSTFVVLIFLRTAAPDLFNRVKEILWIAPFVSLAAGEALAWVQRTLPAGRWMAGGYYAVAIYYGLSFYINSIAEKFVLAR